MPHGRHIYAKSYDMTKSIMFVYPQSDHVLPHWKCVYRCYTKFTSVTIPEQETDDKYSDTRTSIEFQIYHLIERCTTNEKILLNDNLF